MRAASTWVIAGAVLFLAVLAIADAIRSREGTATARPSVQQADGVHGILLVAGEQCRTMSFRLPDMAPALSQRQLDCGGRVWSTDGTVSAACHGSRTTVVSADGQVQFGDIRGCAPAWRPDGALSLVRDGNLVVHRLRGSEQVFMTRAQLSAALRPVVPRQETWAFSEVRWFGLSSFVAIVHGEQPGETAAVVFAAGGLESYVPQFGRYIEGLQTSPLGNFGFAQTVPVRRYVMVSRGGDEIPIPQTRDARAIAWSPDESHVAIATGSAIYIGEPGKVDVSTTIQFGAAALGWLP